MSVKVAMKNVEVGMNMHEVSCEWTCDKCMQYADRDSEK